MFNLNCCWSFKFGYMLCGSPIFKIIQNYIISFFNYLVKKKSGKVCQAFTFKHKVNKSKTKISTNYSIICLYSINICCDQRSIDNFFKIFCNMFYRKTNKLRLLHTKQSDESKFQNTHQDLLHMHHSYICTYAPSPSLFIRLPANILPNT